MIDTDKYGGHTSDWKWIDINEQDDFYLHSEHGDIINHDTPDGKLAQDAPLILEEVKRLYELHALVGVPIPWKVDYGDGGGYETFVADAVEWNYDDSGEWGLVNYNETRWMTLETAKEWMKND